MKEIEENFAKNVDFLNGKDAYIEKKFKNKRNRLRNSFDIETFKFTDLLSEEMFIIESVQNEILIELVEKLQDIEHEKETDQNAVINDELVKASKESIN